eukprot:945420-Rhodomonas_salina.4
MMRLPGCLAQQSPRVCAAGDRHCGQRGPSAVCAGPQLGPVWESGVSSDEPHKGPPPDVDARRAIRDDPRGDGHCADMQCDHPQLLGCWRVRGWPDVDAHHDHLHFLVRVKGCK